MTIGAISQIVNSYTASPKSTSNGHKAASSYKDTATISEAAKELAAQSSGTSAQEEATESVSTKIKEQFSGEK